MTNTSKKVLRRRRNAPGDKPARAPRNAVNFSLTDEEDRRIEGELIKLRQSSGIPVKLGGYAKHALLEHSRLRAIETGFKEFLSSIKGGEGVPLRAIGEGVVDIPESLLRLAGLA